MELPYYVPNITKRSKTKVKGIGVNDMMESTKIIVDGGIIKCPIYDIWVHMLERCTPAYQLKHTHYAGTTVCEAWKYRSNFHEWMVSQKWEGLALDKDILVPDNMEYSPEKCRLVPREINNMLTYKKNLDRKYPLGVTCCKESGKYQAQCNQNGRSSVKIGRFDCPMKAHAAYQRIKSSEIIRKSEEFLKSGGIPEEIYQALVRRADKILKDSELGIETISISNP